MILVNFRGKSSPFGFDAEVLEQIPKDQFHIVDLSNVKASRIYDLLGLYDVAAGVITCDTATLHLAAASRTPYVAFTHDEWRRSVPRGNCQLQMPYSQVPSRANDIGQVVRTWSRSEPKPIVVFDPYEPPSILKQTAWPCEFFNFSKSALPTKEGTDYYNCGLVERPDGDWLVVRRSIWKEQLAYGMNDIVAFKLDGMTPRQAVPINIQRMFAGEHFEDPRVFYYRGLTLVSCVNFLWGTIASVAHQIIVSVGSDWKQVQRYDPIFGRNGPGVMHNVGWEKNWLWFVHNDALHLVYITHPHMVVRFDGKMLPTDIYETKADDLQWPWGDIRGGTPPVRVENEYWSFWHSSVGSGSGHRRYHMGAYCFEAKPPFRMKRYTPKPLLSGSRQDRWAHPKPFVVFPCGAILRGEQWLVSLGVNDLDCAWIKIPHEELVKLTTPVEHSVDLRQTEVLC
ncbi:MAG: hypothetical protein AUG89_11510 [Acidobacteria bacterium 13_1_20CM_4_56_7]|nr:MAG: hypothetical protein AUG89_11510 [Acidobacteria bacterium 13_1_20CM_4_56_7]